MANTVYRNLEEALEDQTMAMNPTPPTPDALLTIVEQLEMLCRDWEKAIHTPRVIDSLFEEGQQDAWRQAQRQIGALIESIKEARASGIYLTDAQKQLVALIEDRHRVTIDFLDELRHRMYTAPLTPAAECHAVTDADGLITGMAVGVDPSTAEEEPSSDDPD